MVDSVLVLVLQVAMVDLDQLLILGSEIFSRSLLYPSATIPPYTSTATITASYPSFPFTRTLSFPVPPDFTVTAVSSRGCADKWAHIANITGCPKCITVLLCGKPVKYEVKYEDLLYKIYIKFPSNPGQYLANVIASDGKICKNAWVKICV